MSTIYPEDWITSKSDIKSANDVRQSRLLYWQRLRSARLEYASETGSSPWTMVDDNRVSIKGFTEWMENKYGIRLEFINGNISGAYTVTNEKKMMMFLLKFPK